MDTATFPSTTAMAATAAVASLVLAGMLFRKPKEEEVVVEYAAHVSQLTIYPVKSAGEIQQETSVVTEMGLEDDRIFQVVTENVDADGNKTLEYCTARDKRFEKLFHLKSYLTPGRRLKLSSPYTEGTFPLDFLGGDPDPVQATVMGGEKFHLEDYGDKVAGFVSKATEIPNARFVGVPQPCVCLDGFMTPDEYQRRVKMNPDQGEPVPEKKYSPMASNGFEVSLADEAPILLASKESLADLNARLKADGKGEVDMRRFRPNIVIEGMEPWEEDCLKRVKIGPVEFHVWQRCGRCIMTTIDRDTLKRGPEPLKTLSTFRERENGQRNFGMHLIPIVEVGSQRGERRINLGSGLEILEYDEKRRAEWKEKFGKK